jgi:hypothetical protein
LDFSKVKRNLPLLKKSCPFGHIFFFYFLITNLRFIKKSPAILDYVMTQVKIGYEIIEMAGPFIEYHGNTPVLFVPD